MKVFSGTVFLQGAIQKPDLQIYWSENQMKKTPFFSKNYVVQKVL